MMLKGSPTRSIDDVCYMFSHCTFVLAYNNTISCKEFKNKVRKCHPLPSVEVENYSIRSKILAALGGKDWRYYSQCLINPGEGQGSFSPEPFSKNRQRPHKVLCTSGTLRALDAFTCLRLKSFYAIAF